MLSSTALLWTRIGAAGALFVVANLVYALWKARRQASSSARWPAVAGEITACEVKIPSTHSSDDDSDCSVEISYRYRVGAKEYKGTHIHAGREAMTTRDRAEETAAKYPVGSRVEVHYRPDRPATALLEPNDTRNLAALIVFLAVFAWIALVLVAHSIAGRVLLLREGGVPLFALFAPLACLAIGILGLNRYLQMRRKLHASAGWPTAAGIITASEVVPFEDTDSDGKGRETTTIKYRAHVDFAYKVDGREFHSSNWKWGWTAIYRDSAAPQAVVAAHPIGKSVPVFYDPNDPASAVLEPANRQGTLAPLIVGVVFGLGGAFMLWAFTKLGQ
jgi:hypothetical protein